jgi:hypothetical protein
MCGRHFHCNSFTRHTSVPVVLDTTENHEQNIPSDVLVTSVSFV